MKDMTHFGYLFELHMAAILDYGIYDTHATLNKCLIRFFDLENIGLDISFAFIAVLVWKLWRFLFYSTSHGGHLELGHK